MVDIVSNFFNPHYGHHRFGHIPLQDFMISMEFEVGGAYEDWGWIMYEKCKDPNTGVQTYRTFCTARTLEKLIQEAEKKLDF